MLFRSAQNATAAYIAKLKDLYQNEMEYLASLSKLSAAPKIDVVAQTADAIGSAVEKAVEEVPPVAEEPEPAPVDEEDEEPTIPMEGKRPAGEDEEEPEEPPMKPLEEDSLYQELRRGPTPRQEIPFTPAAETEEEETPPTEEPTRRIDFSHLKFGKDYEIG